MVRMLGKRKLIRTSQLLRRPRVVRQCPLGIKAGRFVTSQQIHKFCLMAESTDPDLSAAMANQVASVFKTKIKSMMSVVTHHRLNATPSDQPTSPKTKLITLAGAVVVS